MTQPTITDLAAVQDRLGAFERDDLTLMAAIMLGAERPSLARCIRVTVDADQLVALRGREDRLKAMFRLFGWI